MGWMFLFLGGIVYSLLLLQEHMAAKVGGNFLLLLFIIGHFLICLNVLFTSNGIHILLAGITKQIVAYLQVLH